MAQKPLMLKDYLELDSWSESFWWAPLQRAGSTTVRSLLETELARCGPDKTGWKLIRSRSKGALARAFLRSRSFSKKLSRSLSMKRCHEKGDVKVMERGSVFYHSHVVSRCSSSSDDLFVNGKESEALSTRTEKGNLVGGGEESNGTEEKAEEICGKVDMDSPFEEEKEQLSPVSVLDFLYRDEDEDETVVEQPSANSISFEQNIINIERSKKQLLQKIRRFESLANLDPVHLDHHFACTKTHAEKNNEEQSENESPRRLTASALLSQLTGIVSVPLYSEKLLFDFFVEGCASDEELLRQATGWAGAGGNAAEQLGEAAVREMERRGGDWKRFEEEEEIVVVEMTGGVVTLLMEELVDDLLVSVG